MGKLHGTGAAGLGNRDDHIDVARRHRRDHPLGQRLSQIQPCLVDRDAIKHRIRAGKVNEFENTGVKLRRLRALVRMHLTVERDEKRLPGRHIALQHKTSALQGHRFASHHHSAILAAPQGQRTNAMRVTKRHQPMACDQRHHGIGATDTLVHGAHRRKNIVRLQRHAPRSALQLVRKHVEQHF